MIAFRVLTTRTIRGGDFYDTQSQQGNTPQAQPARQGFEETIGLAKAERQAGENS
jgi:hypothetical protein